MTINDPMRILENILSERKPGYVIEAVTLLSELSEKNNARCIAGILKLLDDAAPDELMYALVHAVEKSDGVIYCKAVLDAVERLWTISPQWAERLHVRIMNSPATADAYLSLLDSTPPTTRSTVRAIYEAVARNRPKLSDKVSSFIARLPA